MAGNPEAERCLAAGVAAIAAGDAALAERQWRRAIDLDPALAPAHFNLGLLAARKGGEEAAEEHYRRALAADPMNVGAHGNLGLLLARRGRLGEAELCYRTALAIAPRDADALCNLGVLLAGMKRDGAAEACYRQAIAAAPSHAAAHANLGALLARCHRDDEAESCYRRAIALAPGDATALCNLGVLLARQKRRDEAEACYRQAIDLDPGRAESLTDLGLLLDAEGRDDEAEACHRRALALAPDVAAIHSNLANLLAKTGRADAAEAAYRRAIALAPDAPAGHANLGTHLALQDRDAEAEASFRRALECDPGHPLARVNLGYLLLAQGRLAEGWKYHEARADPGLEDRAAVPPDVPFPPWRGQSLDGRSLLVWPEQGYGDAIQFCRFVPLLKARGAARITLVCKPALKPLLTTLAGADAVVAVNDAASDIGGHDYWCFLMSLPLHCGTTLDKLPASLPYLAADSARLAGWAPRLPVGGLRVGLAWRGNERNDNDADRSLPGLAALAPLWHVPGVAFVSLQKGAGEDEALRPPPRQPLTPLGGEIADFADSAAIIAQLDLVICVDTAIAHLAAALGRPCWVLLPAHKTDWRWLKGRGDTPWYPEVMRLFRQRRRGEWAPLVAQVAAALAEFRPRDS